VKLIPAIDLKNNKCVRLTEGKKNTSIVYNDDPVDQAKIFEQEGCERIHIVDLDAAFGEPEINKQTILNIKKFIKIPIQLGGGIRNSNDVEFWFNNNIEYLIIGSMAVKDIEKTLSIINLHGEKIYISLDQLKEKIMISGWTEKTNLNYKDVIEIYNKSKTRGFIFTDISRDGMMKGLNIDLIHKNLSIVKKKMIVGGGLSNYTDLEELKKINNIYLEGVIAGKSFYSGSIKINKAINILKTPC
tara:strand:+ start:109 stop:840 length:732 start_codon:yes stop_codon:yes gene_type:complete